MKILLISGLNDYGWWEHVTKPPKYYGWGAFGDMFPNNVFYISLIDFFEGNKKIPFDIDIVIVVQAKSPENYHVGVFKKIKSTLPRAKIVMIQEDDIRAIFRMSARGQIDHFTAVNEYVDIVYVHEDDLAIEMYKELNNPLVRIFHTPYPVEWSRQFFIPYEQRKYDLLVTGSISRQYAGIRAWLLVNSFYNNVTKAKVLSTMSQRYNGHVNDWCHLYLPEMHWHEWIKRIAKCKEYFRSSLEIGAKSLDIACKSLDVRQIKGYKQETLFRKIMDYDFSVRRKEIKSELEAIMRK